ncbi:MAG: radical SAM protein [Desulfobacteraceae bacterium]|nr:radical SAM protein [Desulfobacteraceae bacterium]
MKLVLIQLPTSHFGAGEKVYPLGLSRLSSLVPDTVEKRGLDMNIVPDPWGALKTLLTDYRPDMAVLSFRNLDPLAGHQTSYLSSLKTGAALIRTLIPDCRIMAGGPAFSLFAQRLMAEVPEIDLGLIGEGEPVFVQLLVPGADPSTVPGVLWREKGEIRVTPPGPKMDMDRLPPLDTQVFLPTDYTGANAYVAAMGIEGKRGCDLWCGYCLYPFLGGTCMRLRAPDFIVREMKDLRDRFNIRLFHFTDSVVNRPADYFEALCREMIKAGLDVSWTGFFREDGFTDDNLSLAMDAGLAAVYFSGDALTDEGLSLLNKRLTCDQILEAARLTAGKKILTMSHFLVNLPGETEDRVRRSEAMLDRLLEIHAPAGNLGAVIFNHVRLYPGAPLTRRLIGSGRLDPETDFLYPVYHNPAPFRDILHRFEAKCHTAGVFSRFGLDL